MQLFLLIVASVLLSGCSQTLYVKDGATPQQFQADQFECEQKVVTMYGGYAQMGVGHAIMARQDIMRCMTSKGYREATEEDYKRVRPASVVPAVQMPPPPSEAHDDYRTDASCTRPNGQPCGTP